MPISTNRIADFEFIAFRGDPHALRQQVQVLTRPGVPGITVLRSGVRGVPFELGSFVDARNGEHGRYLYKSYLNLIGQPPVGLTWNGLDMTSEKFTVVVLDVKAEVKAIRTSIGGLNPPSGAVVIARWQLVAVDG